MILLNLLLILIVGLSATSGWQLVISPSEERLQNRRSNENFLIVCKVKEFDGAASDVKIEWYKHDAVIPRFGSTMTIERTYSNQLMINRPKIADGGKYTCKASIGEEKQEVSAEISFVDPPKFVNVKNEQHPEEGTRAEIVCEVEGADQLEVFWQFNGVTLDEVSQRGYNFSENKQILYIPNFTAKKDDGIYNCNAAQYSSFETLPINVTGYARPSITVFDVPSGNRGIEGSTVELKCGAVGKPKPTYKWFFEDDEIPIARSDKHNIDEGLLVIESLNSEDAGSYKCIASNTVGTNERSFDLSVFLKPKVELKTEYVVKEGEDVEVVCGYHSEGQTTVKFVSGSREFTAKTLRNENTAESQGSEETVTLESVASEELSDETDAVELTTLSTDTDENSNEETYEETKKWKRFTEDVYSQRISVESEENKLILSIKKISLEDAGEYSCIVSNEAGTTTKISRVGIIHPPTLRHYTGPHVRSFDDSSVSIYCDVSAVPYPTWQWFKDGEEVEANGVSIKIDTQTSSTKLTLDNIEGTDNYGVYTCKADNGVGQLEKKIEVIRVVKPVAPVGMDCKKMIYPNYGKCSFDESSYKDENSRPETIEYLIAKLEDMESDYNWSHAQQVVVKFENDITIGNLDANTQYFVKFRVSNEAGSSDYTEEISLETTDPWAPQSPSSVKMECSDYCTVSWDTPNDHGSPLLKYRIAIQEMQLKKDDDESSTAQPSETETELEESEKNSETNEADTNEADTVETTETSDKSQETLSEEILPSDTSEDSAEVLPTDLTTEVQNDEDDDEKVPHGSPVILEVESDKNELQLTNIKPHSYYKISVAAINSVGQGETAEIDHQTDESPTKFDDGIDNFWVVTAISVGVFFILFFIDLGCFLTNRCGLISCICLNICGRNSGAKQRDIESGRGPESNRLLDSGRAR